jgi:uncharacterized protein with beta-barrel porin domain
MNNRIVIFSTIAAATLFNAGTVKSQQLVNNGTFTGCNGATCSGWTLTGSGSLFRPGQYVNGTVSPNRDSIYQGITTQPGRTYRINYSLRLQNLGNPYLVRTTFGSNVLSSVTSGLTTTPTNFSYTSVASSTTSNLEFYGYNDPDYWVLTDVSVTLVDAGLFNYSTLQPYADIQSISLDALKNQRELVLNTAGDCDQKGWVVYDSEKVKGKKPNKNKSLCVFAEGGYAQGAINGSTSVGGYDATNASSAYGIEWKPSKKWAVGAAYGYGSANLGNFSFQDTSAFINSNVNSGNIYGVYRPSKNWKIAALAGYSNFNFTGSRTYLGDTANSTFASNGYTAALEASYDIILSKDFNNKKNPLAPVRIKPLVGLAWGGNQQNGFSETGSGTLFNVQGNTTNSLMATFGAKLEAPIPLNKKKTTALIPKFGIAYQYDGLAVLDANKSITAAQQTSSTTSFTEVGQNRGPNGIYLDLGGDLQINPSLVVYANVNYQAFTYGNQIGYQGGLRMKL